MSRRGAACDTGPSLCNRFRLREGNTLTEKPNPARKRKPPTELKISEESQAALRARLDSEEGQRYLDQFAKLIAEWAVERMPAELLQGLVQEKGHETLKGLWPDIVNAFFRSLSNPAPRK